MRGTLTAQQRLIMDALLLGKELQCERVGGGWRSSDNSVEEMIHKLTQANPIVYRVKPPTIPVTCQAYIRKYATRSGQGVEHWNSRSCLRTTVQDSPHFVNWVGNPVFVELEADHA